MGAIFASICSAALALSLCANAEQIDQSAFSSTFTVSFPGYRGTTTLTGFPVLVRLSPELNEFKYSKCKSDGSDVRFADSDGNLLASEIDSWNPNGTSLVWVKVPTFNTNTLIRAYYGCANPPAVYPRVVHSKARSTRFASRPCRGRTTGSRRRSAQSRATRSSPPMVWRDGKLKA